MTRGPASRAHPDALQLAHCAAGEGDAGSEAHVRACTTCATEVAGLRRAMEAVAGSGHAAMPAATACLDEDTLAAVAEGGLPTGSRREDVLAHIAGCARCRATIATVTGALSDDAIAAEIRSLEPRRARQWPRIASAVAAAGLVLVLMWPASTDEGAGVHRGGSSGGGAAPELLAPRGAVAQAGLLRWRGVPGADVYRFTIYDAQGAVLHEAVTADTVVALPAGLRLVPGERYHWTAAARVGWERWTVAELVEFSVQKPEP